MTENTDNYEYVAENPRFAATSEAEERPPLANANGQPANTPTSAAVTAAGTGASAAAEKGDFTYAGHARLEQNRTKEHPGHQQPAQAQHQEQPAYRGFHQYAAGAPQQEYAPEQLGQYQALMQGEPFGHYPQQGLSPNTPEEQGQYGRYEHRPWQTAPAQSAYAHETGMWETYAQEPYTVAAYMQPPEQTTYPVQTAYARPPAQGGWPARANNATRTPNDANVNLQRYPQEDPYRYGGRPHAPAAEYSAYPSHRSAAVNSEAALDRGFAAAAQEPYPTGGTTLTEIQSQQAPFDFDFVQSTARIALYDDLRSAPKVTEITPNTTAEYIENLASKIYEQAKLAGGTIPYTVIREVSENFIHARFTEVTVSIFDDGNTIRFADQGPGIKQKEKAKLPGFTSAIEPMKRYIRGVGSGLPIVREYLEVSHGTISIEDNLGTGAVVTISLEDHPSGQPRTGSRGNEKTNPTLHAQVTGALTQREKDFLALFLDEGALGVTDLGRLTGLAASSTHATLKKLEEHGLVEKTTGQKRILTDLGFATAENLR